MPSARILAVDDDEGLLQLEKDMLERQGYTVMMAETGPKAIELAQKELPDLVLLDVMMPGMDGIEVCRQLRQDPRTEGILITFVTARGKLQDKEDGFSAGGDDYLVKPFSMRELVLRVHATLERAGRIREQVEAEQSQRIVEEKRAAVVELAGAASHEMNQLLFAIRAYVRVLSSQMDKARVRDDLNQLEEALSAMGQLIRKLGQVKRYETKTYMDDIKILDLDKAGQDERK
jgi:DNA-binding response OmpR family regulator